MFDRVVNTPLNCLITPSIYLLNVSHRNPRTMFEICSKLTIKTPERSHWRHSGVFIVNFKNIAHFVLVFLLLTLNMQLPVGNDPYTNKLIPITLLKNNWTTSPQIYFNNWPHRSWKYWRSNYIYWVNSTRESPKCQIFGFICSFISLSLVCITEVAIFVFTASMCSLIFCTRNLERQIMSMAVAANFH